MIGITTVVGRGIAAILRVRLHRCRRQVRYGAESLESTRRSFKPCLCPQAANCLIPRQASHETRTVRAVEVVQSVPTEGTTLQVAKANNARTAASRDPEAENCTLVCRVCRGHRQFPKWVGSGCMYRLLRASTAAQQCTTTARID